MNPYYADQIIPSKSTNIMDAYIFALCATMLSTAMALAM